MEQIKERLSVVDVIGSYVKLEKAGSNYKARCPFHNEKTPSFFVSPARNSYYCFGCNAKGDIFSFVEQFEGLDFVGALKVLAQRAGVVLQHENQTAKNEKERLYRLLDIATEFYQQCFEQDAESKNYLQKRGVKAETIKGWRLGFAPDSWRALYDELIKRGFGVVEMQNAGLVKKSETSSGYYDMFRGRVMFPIFDSSDRVIGFSGRLLPRLDDGKSGKYVNSPETMLFNKSRVLYGLNKAKYDIRKRDYSIMVEGQMDLIMSHQAGFTNTVAVSGTALSADTLADEVVTNLGLLSRLSKNVILAFDSDDAGFKASGRNAKIALSIGMDVKVAKMPDGDDPADIILRSPLEWSEIIKNSKHVIDFSLETLIDKKYDPRKLGREIVTSVLPYVKALQSAIDQSHFITKIADLTGIKEDALWVEFKKIDQDIYEEKNDSESILKIVKKVSDRKNEIKKKILGIIYWLESHKDPMIDFQDIMEKLRLILGETDLDQIIKENELNKNELIFEAELSYERATNLKQAVGELLLNLEQEMVEEKLAETMSKIYSSRGLNNTDEIKLVQQLNKRKQELKDKRQSPDRG